MNTDLGPIDQKLRATASRPSRQADRELERINQALARLDDGRFGYCESCGAEISIARLMHDPATVLCGDCDETE
ncbi:MAG: TraR/DksA C4-type zinc finger protein [Pseudomonadota bacterium]